jgi:hypothetical protein
MISRSFLVMPGAVLLLTLGILAAGVGLAAHHAVTADQQAAKKEGAIESSSKNPDDPVSPDGKQARRDWLGDPLPSRAVARIGTTRWWHGRTVQECPSVFTPDGKSFACCDGKAVRFLDATTGKERTCIASDDEITRFEFAYGTPRQANPSRIGPASQKLSFLCGSCRMARS